MKHAFRLSRLGAAALMLAFLYGAFVSSSRVPTSRAQSAALSPTPDNLVMQITSSTIPFIATPTPSPTATPTPSPTATPAPNAPINRNSFASSISGDGRFVAIESEGDIATPGPGETNANKARHNRDGNLEIFLFDYAQRRIYQITDTRHALKDAALSSIVPSNIDVPVVNQRPIITHDGKFLIFSSNAYSDAAPSLTPKSFNGQNNVAALKADANSEIFVYPIPAAPTADLSAGVEIPETNLAANTPVRVTFTPASALPRPGTANAPPFFADDNRPSDATDDGSYIAFVTQATAGLAGVSNTDGNPEIVIARYPAVAFTQVTNTTDIAPTAANPLGTLIVNDNPSLSGGFDAAGNLAPITLAFISNADINSTEADADKRNGEVHVATFNRTTVSNLRPVTRTPPERRAGFEGSSVNFMISGRRVSRDGNYVLFESTAVFNRDGSLNGALASTSSIYLYNNAANNFTQVANRVPDTEASDIPVRYPTFTGDSARVVWASTINLKTDGTVAAAGSADGLNPNRGTQIFTTPIAQLIQTTAVNQVTRLTRLPTLVVSIQPIVSDTIRRIAFSQLGTFPYGEGNADGSSEALYLLVPTATSETPAPSPSPASSPAPVTFSTGASDRPVVAASPAPSPSPQVTALAPGMLGIARSTLALAPSERQIERTAAHEVNRRPALPVELNGVTVSINNAAAGLYSVAPGQINFVVPPGVLVSTTPASVVINNNGAVIRTSLLLIASQPDIFTSTNGPGGRAAVLNVTNACISPPGEPFNIQTVRPTGNNCMATTTEMAPTRLLIMVTGVSRTTTTAQVTVRIKETDLTGAAIISVGPSLTPGFDQIIVELPPSLAAAGDSPIIVTVGGVSSRPADTAPRITIN